MKRFILHNINETYGSKVGVGVLGSTASVGVGVTVVVGAGVLVKGTAGVGV
jgi:hypothetical protein